MKPEYSQVLVPFIGLFFNIFTQLASLRLFPWIGLLKSEFCGFILGMLVFLSIQSAFIFCRRSCIDSPLGIFIVNSIIYLSLAYMYFNFINLGETARRIRLLSELYNCRVGLTYPEIIQRYNAKEVLNRRVLRLLNNGQIVYRDGRYFTANPSVLIISQGIFWMKQFLLGRKLSR